jgi:hypothetical protein
MKQIAMYEQDFYAWSVQTATLIRQGSWSEIDALNLAEEIESMGRSEKRELINRLAILMMHLLKWQFQSERRSRSWEGTIDEQRQQVHDLLEDSPSLTYELETKPVPIVWHSQPQCVKRGCLKPPFQPHVPIPWRSC